MKSTNSKLLKTLKANYFNSINANFDSYQGAFNKKKDRLSTLEFELERKREIIIQLRSEIASKDKEISLLKVSKNKKSEEYKKSMKVIEEILKQCDLSTTSGFKTIENSVMNSNYYLDSKNNNINNNINIDNKNKSFTCKNKVKESLTPLPQIGNMLHFTTQHKKTMKDMVYISLLKKQINNLNEEIAKRDEKISELKKNQNSTNFAKLKSNFLKNYDELTEIKKENEFMKTRIEDVHHLLKVEKEDNINLKNKLHDFHDQYLFYKDNTTKKTTALENMLAKMRTKQRECKIFHLRKGTSAMAIRLRKAGDKEQSLDEKYEDEFEKNNNENNNNKDNEIKKMAKTLSQLKEEHSNKDNLIKILKKEKKDLIEELKKKDNDKNLILKENKEIKELNKKLENDLKGKESLIDEEKTKTNAIKELLKEQEEQNNKLNIKIQQLEKTIEELQKELIKYKDNMFLTNVDIKKLRINQIKIMRNIMKKLRKKKILI